MISSHFIGFSWIFHEKCNGFSLAEPKFQLIFRTTDFISLDVHIFHVEKQNCQLNKQWKIIGHWWLDVRILFFSHRSSYLFPHSVGPHLLIFFTYLNQIILQKTWESFILALIYSFIFLFFSQAKIKIYLGISINSTSLFPHKLKISFSLHWPINWHLHPCSWCCIWI